MPRGAHADKPLALGIYPLQLAPMENSTLSARYTGFAIFLHWAIAALIVLNIIAAWVSEDMPKPDRAMIMGNHKAIGIVVILLTVVRIVWRLIHKAPPLVDTLKPWEVTLSKAVHGLLYLLMLVLPLSGWAMVSSFSKGEPVNLFGLFAVPALPVGYDKPTTGLFHEMHELTAWAMIALVVIHVAAALKHRIIDKDVTLQRMAPWMR